MFINRDNHVSGRDSECSASLNQKCDNMPEKTVKQSLIHNLSVNEKGKLTWNSSYESLQRFFDESLNLENGQWSSSGGGAKQCENEGVSVRWYTKSKTITVSGRDKDKDKILDMLYSRASVSKQLDETDVNAMNGTNKTENYMQAFENRLRTLSEELTAVHNTLRDHSDAIKQIKNQDKETELITLRKENLDLKNENKNLNERIN